MDEDDLLDMKQCNGVVVASAIFGNIYMIWFQLTMINLFGFLPDKSILFREF